MIHGVMINAAMPTESAAAWSAHTFPFLSIGIMSATAKIGIGLMLINATTPATAPKAAPVVILGRSHHRMPNNTRTTTPNSCQQKYQRFVRERMDSGQKLSTTAARAAPNEGNPLLPVVR